jgi:transposase InsO family protein
MQHMRSQSNQEPGPDAAVQWQYNVSAPFERIAIDVAGPFPRSDQGNRYLLIAMDYFTKWPEAYAIPNQEAATVGEALVTNFFCSFGVPRELHSDQGRNFESRLMQEVLEHLGVNKTRTTPLHPQSDGMVERYIKTVEEHLRKVIASEGQGRKITHLPPCLPSIHPRHYRLDPRQPRVWEGTPPAQRPAIWSTS